MKFESLTGLKATAKYLERIGAEERSIRTAVVKEQHSSGYWTDKHVIKFSKEGVVTVRPDTNPLVRPTTSEAETIRAEFADIEWPDCVYIEDENDPNLPEIWNSAPKSNRFVYRDENGNIIMLQVRIDEKKGKKYVPITLWDDGQYRFAEPGEKIPLYGLENIKKHSTVLIVEGAKTARYVQWLVDGETQEAIEARNEHPWGQQLQYICVLGWSSGALSPSRTDWEPIRKAGITRAYVSLDNDSVGVSALPEISKNLRCVTHAIQFSEEWPTSADLFDPFPEVFFKKIDGRRYYVGPSFHDCMYAATWMTDLIEVPNGKTSKMVPVLRPHVRNLYQWVEQTGTFCYLEMPEDTYTAETLDNMLRPFSDTKKVSELLLQNFNGRTTTFDYSPATDKRRIIVNGKSVINLYTPPSIKPQKGDPKPWLEFMEQLIPDVEERRHMLRWIATLYARPEIRIIWAPLLISEKTGTGKSTLGQIVAELVGRNNTSFPSEQVIGGEFNSWIAQKRLVVVNEVYQGQSWRMFTKLKDMITEPSITLRKMHRDPVDISNWAHFLMFSNSLAALKIDAQDRRIFAPTVTEERWGDDKWDYFHDWLASGGYSIIAQWCLNFGDYVYRGERAPETERKRDMIEASVSRAHQKVEELASIIANDKKPVAFSICQVSEWIELVTKNKVYESTLELRKLFTNFGIHDQKKLGIKKRISHKSMLTYFVFNDAAIRAVDGMGEAQIIETLKSFVKNPTEIVNNEQMM